MGISNKQCKFEKESEQLVFKWQTFGVFQIFQIYGHLCNIVKYQ